MTLITTTTTDEFPWLLRYYLLFASTGTFALALKQLFDPMGALRMLVQPALHHKLLDDRENNSDLVKLAAGMTRWCGCFFIVFSLANAYLTTLPLSQAKPLMRAMGVCWVLDALVVKLLGFHTHGPHIFNKADAVGGGSFDLFTGLLLLVKSMQ